MALVVTGHVVPLDRHDPSATFRGSVFIGDDGAIDAVTKGAGTNVPGFDDAPRVDVGTAIVLPGLIDLHNHLGYNTLPLWSEPAQTQPFRHHNDWTDAPTYKPKVTWPAWVIAKADPGALLAYVQARALAGGATAQQGWPASSRKIGEGLRNVDDEEAGSGTENLIYTAVVTKTPLELSQVAQKVTHGTGFIYHCAEGARGSVVASEFVDAANAGCLQRTFVGVHCNAISDADWHRWTKADAGAVAWSPFSNLWLYGETTDVTAARERGVSICLGSDWGPSGTKNILGEMKVARLASDELDFGITDEELVGMVTANPGDVLSRCWHRPVGRLVQGAFADVTVLKPRGNTSVWSQVVRAREADVLLTIVDGQPRYGDPTLMREAGVRHGSTLSVAGKKKKLALPDPDAPGKTVSWSDIRQRLDGVRKNPAAAVARTEGRRRAWSGSLDADDAPLELALDMPGGGGLAFAGPPPAVDEVEIPRLPSLAHDASFFASVRGHGFHGGVLDGLEEYYQ
jgi:cytosine/adenosine deaminase-related metal-dependent hydrolase